MRTVIILIVVLAVAVIGALWWADYDFRAPGPAVAETVVAVKPGSGLSQIAGQLDAAGVVQRALLFRAGVMRRGQAAALKAGEDAFPARASTGGVFRMAGTHKG